MQFIIRWNVGVRWHLARYRHENLHLYVTENEEKFI
jgi:hypothetical protein